MKWLHRGVIPVLLLTFVAAVALWFYTRRVLLQTDGALRWKAASWATTRIA